MNSTTYRLIFNPQRGCIMAVAETASSSGKASGSTRGTRCKRRGITATARATRNCALDQAASQWIRSQAGLNSIATAKQTSSASEGQISESHSKEVKSSGLMTRGSLSNPNSLGFDLKRGASTSGTRSSTTQAGSSITSASGNTTLIADKGVLAVIASNVSAGADKQLTLQGAQVYLSGGLNSEETTSQAKQNATNIHAGIVKPSEGILSRGGVKGTGSSTSLAATTLSGGNIDIRATGTPGKNADGSPALSGISLAGVKLSTPGELNLNAGDGKLAFNILQTTTSSSKETTQRDLAYQKAQGEGSTSTEAVYNELNYAKLTTKAAGGVTVQQAQSAGSKGAITPATLTELSAQPGMGWIADVQRQQADLARSNPAAALHVQNVQLAHEQWDYKQQGLTKEGAIIVAVVVAYFTAGAGSSLVGAAGGTAGGAAAGATAGATTGAAVGATAGAAAGAGVGTAIAVGVAQAAITTLATQASISLINNQGDLGATFKELGSKENVKALVTAMVTGGVLGGMNFSPTGQPAINGGAQTFTSQLGQNLQTGITKSLISTAINGGSLEDSLKGAIVSALLDTSAAQGAFAIGQNFTGLANTLAHALAGCAAGAARAGSDGCAPGALGAALGELAAEAYGKRPDTVEFAAMISGIGAALAGGDAAQISLASSAGANAAANNFLSRSPFKEVQARVNQENARLTLQCGDNCTLEQMRSIDLQMQRLEAAGNLLATTQNSKLTTAQAVQLGETLAALLPFYGTPIALYQAISGKSLSGSDLSGVEQFFNGVAAAIPAGGAAYRLINSAVADMRLASSAGGIAADGIALMNFSMLTNAQKGVVGELLGSTTVQNALPGAIRLGRLGEVGSQGIDDLYKVTSANADYVIVEYKFGTSPLKTTADGVQMSDGWVAGNNRLIEIAGKDTAQAIGKAMEVGRVEKWVVHTDPAGGTSIWIVDAAGKYIKANSEVVSKVLGASK